MANAGSDTAAAHFDAAAARYEALTGGCTRALAQYVLSLPQFGSTVPSLDNPNAVVLDNACGTALVTEEVLKHHPEAQVHAVDAAPNMIHLAKGKLMGAPNIKLHVMPGEKLDYPDETFTHSITNLGILFFSSPPEGAREIYRTLKSGGVAIVTSWARLGTVEDAIIPAQRIVRPDDQPFKLPIPTEWFDPNHVEECLKKDGGFRDVQILTHTVYYGAATQDELTGLVLDSYKSLIWENWLHQDQKAFRERVQDHIETKAQEYMMTDGKLGCGLPMDAIIAICRK